MDTLRAEFRVPFVQEDKHAATHRRDSSAEGLCLRAETGKNARGSINTIDKHFGHHHDLLVIFVQL